MKGFKSYALLSIAVLNGCQTTSQQDVTTEAPASTTIEQSAFFVNHAQPPKKSSPKEQDDVWERISMQLSFPVPDEERVEYYRNWYIDNPQHLKIVAERAKPFLYLITKKIEERNIPLELALLPIVESSFDQFAYSHGRAAGLWQFVPDTAQRFGLEQTWWYDGRRDVVESTDAAIDLLVYLHKKFDGDWLHALAAYNTGEGRVFRAIRNNKKKGKPTDFWSLDLPSETSSYVPKLIAIADVLKNKNKYGVTFGEIANKPVVELISPNVQMDLAIAAEFADIPLSKLQNLNPAYNRWATSPEGVNHLLLPIANVAEFKKNMQENKGKEVRITRYKVKNGDALIRIARQHNTTVGIIRKVNSLDTNQIIIGQHLLIPVAFKDKEDYPLSVGQRLNKIQRKTRGKSKIDYRVVEGDSLWSIGKEYGVSLNKIADWNGMSPKDPLHVGKKLVIWQETDEALKAERIRTIVYKIKSGDSLSIIASRYNVSLTELLEWNMLESDRLIRPGQKLTLHINVNQT